MLAYVPYVPPVRRTNSSPDAWKPAPSKSPYHYIEEAAFALSTRGNQRMSQEFQRRIGAPPSSANGLLSRPRRTAGTNGWPRSRSAAAATGVAPARLSNHPWRQSNGADEHAGGSLRHRLPPLLEGPLRGWKNGSPKSGHPEPLLAHFRVIGMPWNQQSGKAPGTVLPRLRPREIVLRQARERWGRVPHRQRGRGRGRSPKTPPSELEAKERCDEGGDHEDHLFNVDRNLHLRPNMPRTEKHESFPSRHLGAQAHGLDMHLYRALAVALSPPVLTRASRSGLVPRGTLRPEHASAPVYGPSAPRRWTPPKRHTGGLACLPWPNQESALVLLCPARQDARPFFG